MNTGALIYAVVLGIICGVGGGLLFAFDTVAAAALLGAAAFLFVLSRFVRDRTHLFSAFLLCAIFCASISVGVVRADFLHWQESRATIGRAIGKRVVVEGKIRADPDRRATNTHLTIAVSQIDGKAARGNILAMVPTDANVSYGDEVVLQGMLELPESFASEGGREFDYPSYLRVRGVSALMSRAKVERVASSGISFAGVLFDAKHAFEHSLARVFPPQSAALMEGVLFGERKGLPQHIEQVLVAAGLIHIVILAGYALSLVAQGVLDALSFLRPRYRYALAAFALVSFVVMTGGQATTVRACAMAVIAMLARYLHRRSLALRSLAVVICGMLLFNPLYFLFDESFIISALATFGLITLGAFFDRLFIFLPERFDMRGIASSTLAVQIFALPAILYYTGTLSLYALPANLLALPMLPIVMLFGFFAGLLGLISPLAAFIPAALANLFLHGILFIAHSAAELPFGGAIIPAFPVWIMIVAYVFLFAIAIQIYRKNTITSLQ